MSSAYNNVGMAIPTNHTPGLPNPSMQLDTSSISKPKKNVGDSGHPYFTPIMLAATSDNP